MHWQQKKKLNVEAERGKRTEKKQNNKAKRRYEKQEGKEKKSVMKNRRKGDFSFVIIPGEPEGRIWLEH